MKVRSRLVKYTASGINPDTRVRDVWEVSFIGNNPDDRRDWLKMANAGGFKDIKLIRKPTAAKAASDASAPKPDMADIAREGLKMLDALIAARKAKAA